MTANDYISRCDFCNGSIPLRLNLDGSARKRQQKYCNQKCRRRNENKNKLMTRMCVSCGNPFEQTRSSNTKYCSNACKVWRCKHWREYQYGPVFVKEHIKIIGPFDCAPCAICSAWVFNCHARWRPLCDDHNTISIAARRMLSRGVNEMACKYCGVKFCGLYGRGKGSGVMKHCSLECSKKTYKILSQKHGAKRRSIMESPEADNIDPIKVFERDKWNCHLCGRKTRKDKRGTYHHKAPELEHIVALADGGTHTWGNVACSCRRCNSHKGSSSKGQLGLAIAC